MSIEYKNDGLLFQKGTLRIENIIEQSKSKGIRASFYGVLDTAKFKIQLDIGFGDEVIPESVSENLNCLFEFHRAKLNCYSKESCIAEKFQTIVEKNEINSRIKDYYDIWFLITNFTFEKNILKHAIETTLKNRGTIIPEKINGLTVEFAKEKQGQWTAFSKKINTKKLPCKFETIVLKIDKFIKEILLPVNQEK